MPSSKSRAPPTGVYAPTLSFWKGRWNAEPDLDCFRRHLTRWANRHPDVGFRALTSSLRLCDDGITGVDLFTFWGEGHLVRPNERLQFLKVAKEVLKPAGVHFLVECGRESWIDTVERIGEASEAGADYAVLNVPITYEAEMVRDDIFSYFHGVSQNTRLSRLAAVLTRPLQISEAVNIPFILRAPPADSNLSFTADFIRRLNTLPKCVGAILPAFDPIIPEVAEEFAGGDEFAIYCTYPGDMGAKDLGIRLQTSITNVIPFAISETYKSDEHRFGETMQNIITTKVLREVATKTTALKVRLALKAFS